MDINIFKNKRVIVLGYGRSGRSAVNMLSTLGADIVLTTNEIIADESVRRTLKGWEVEIVDGHHPTSLLNEADLIVKNPGIPYRIPFLQEAGERGIPIITEVELAYQMAKVPIIGITGTNGKTTVTHLIGEMLERAGKNPILCGNIGFPASEAVLEAESDNILVMELSSFQLMGIRDFRPNVAVFTNIYKAHLDYHSSLEEYIGAKLNLLRKMTGEDLVIFNGGQKELLNNVDVHSAVEYFSADHIEEAYIKEQTLMIGNKPLISLEDIALKGSHNHENILAAILAVKRFGVSDDEIVSTLKTFGGIPHRMEYVGGFKNVDYYNDSKATNSLATSFALKSFNRPIIWIAGGLDRGQSLEDLSPYLDYVKLLITFGETTEKFKALGKHKNIDVIESENPYDAVAIARDEAVEGEVVLFSPACASWDQYKDFEARGNHFKEGFFALKD